MRRRRFMQIAAAAVMAPGAATAEALWRGVAMGADAEVRLTGPRERAEATLDGVAALLERVEATFSLYRDTELTRLNAEGRLAPSPWFRQIVTLSGRLYRLTGGAFDPSVQPLWLALAGGGDVRAARGQVGWHRVAVGNEIRLEPGMALTFNGIAQGFATDLVCAHLAAHGFRNALVNIGEFRTLGGPFRLGISDPIAGVLAEWHLASGALAVSSPFGTELAGQAHIQHPAGLPPLWSTVAVEADTAALADGLSTGLVFLDRLQIAALKQALPALRRVALVDAAGNLETV